MTGRQKAKVFPDPVNAIPIISLPENLNGAHQKVVEKVTRAIDLRRRDALYLNWRGLDDLALPQMLYYITRYLHVL